MHIIKYRITLDTIDTDSQTIWYCIEMKLLVLPTTNKQLLPAGL